jgi:iron(III) transport system ATP-binding protein
MSDSRPVSPILRVQSVTKHYSEMTAPAVSSVSLTLSEGEILGLLGPSGCGKTTLLRLIAGFERPETGSIELAGRVVADHSHWVPPEQRSIGMVFQDFALFPHLTVAQNVAAQTRMMESIELVGLKGMENRYPNELSGGQQQRVALARALAPRPALILLDEPLSNLDVQVRLYLRQEVRDILKRTGISAVFVTHDQEEALSISDQVVVMRQGHMEQVGTPEMIYWQPASRFVAEFVTQANFLPAQCQDQVWQTEVGCFAVDVVSEGAAADVAQGELMIRQEDLQIEPDEAGALLIRDRQFLGREYRYCLQTASGQELHARTHTHIPLPVGSRVRIAVSNQAWQFFPTSISPLNSSRSTALRAS